MISFRIRPIQIASFVAAVSAISAPALTDAGHGHGSIGESAKASAAARTVQVELGDNFYEPKTIQVNAGETVRFVLKNTGRLLHEFNIGTAAMHTEHRKEMTQMMERGLLTPTGINHAMMGSQHGGSHGHAMKHDDPNSVLVEPGRTKELVWKFSRAADLEFACNIPGHYESGMVGNIRFGR